MTRTGCILCRDVDSVVTDSVAFSKRITTFRSILENALDNYLPILNSELRLCENCVDLLNLFDLTERNYKVLKEKIVNYCVGFKVQAKKFDASCQTEESVKTELYEIKSSTDEISDNVEFEFVDSEHIDQWKSTIILEEFKCYICYENFITEEERIVHLKAMHQITIKKARKEPPKKNLTNSKKKAASVSSKVTIKNAKTGQVLLKPIVIGDITLDVYLAERENDTFEDGVKLARPRVAKKVITQKKAKRTTLKPIIISNTNINDQLFEDRESVECSEVKTEFPLYYECEFCSESWNTQEQLEKHKCPTSEYLEICSITEEIPIAQTNPQPFICEICGQIFKRKHDLDPHIRAHRGIYPYYCSYCKKPFTKKGSLQRHLPIHTGEIQYQCELCGKSFIHNSSFTTHMLLHAGRKDYKCATCGFALFSKTHLERHMRVHTKEKPYPCEICPKRFAEKYNLYTHLKVHKKAFEM